MQPFVKLQVSPNMSIRSKTENRPRDRTGSALGWKAGASTLKPQVYPYKVQAKSTPQKLAQSRSPCSPKNAEHWVVWSVRRSTSGFVKVQLAEHGCTTHTSVTLHAYWQIVLLEVTSSHSSYDCACFMHSTRVASARSCTGRWFFT